jgi:predicted SAM-dependent methyltransferase
VCDRSEFEDYRGVSRGRCRSCRSNERTRVAKLFLDRHVALRAGQRVLHLAPERQLAGYIFGIVGGGYESADMDPDRYAGDAEYSVRRFDLCADSSELPSNHYDLVMHNHVLEHVPCNYTLVLQDLHRAVKPGGVHMFSVPILAGYFAEDLDPGLSEPERTRKFGQNDHLRRFGRADFEQTLGKVLGLKASYSLADYFPERDLMRANIRRSQWSCSGSSIFYLRKGA